MSGSVRFALTVLVVLLARDFSAAQPDLDPERGVLRARLEQVVIQSLADLTTAPQRASNTVHPDARAVAPALQNVVSLRTS